MFVGVVTTPGLMVLCMGLAILGDKRPEPILPRWLGYTMVWLTLLFIPGNIMLRHERPVRMERPDVLVAGRDGGLRNLHHDGPIHVAGSHQETGSGSCGIGRHRGCAHAARGSANQRTSTITRQSNLIQRDHRDLVQP